MIVETTSKPRWAVVGGGMLGLTMAHRMAKEGRDVTLIEAAPKIGGLTSVWELGDVTWDKFYHVILMTDTNLRSLLEEIELDDALQWSETKTGFFTDGKMYSMSNTVEFLSFPPLKLIEKLRLGGTIFLASKIKNWKRLEKIHVDKWLRRWSGNGTFKKIWEPLLNAKLGESYKKTAASFIWAHISRMYKARRSGLKKEMFGYVKGGYGTIINRIEKKLIEYGAEIRTNFPISNVVKNEDDTFTIENANGETEIFDRVVMTAPSSIVRRICPLLSDDEMSRLNRIEYLGIVCASMLLKKPISPYYVTNITDTWVPMTAVIEMSNIVKPEELGGQSLVYLPKYLPADHPDFEKSDEDFKESFLSALEKMHPEFSRDQVIDFKICRTKHVMAIPTIRYSELLPPQKTSAEGFYLVNSSYILKGNLNVNETIEIAETAYRDVISKDNGLPVKVAESTTVSV